MRERNDRGQRGAYEHETTLQCGCCIFEFLIFQQMLDQRITHFACRHFLVLFRNIFGFFMRQQTCRFDFQQRRSNEEKVARHIQVDVAHTLHFRQILVGDFRKRDRPDAHFLTANQIQKQIERALEAFYANTIRHAYKSASNAFWRNGSYTPIATAWERFRERMLSRMGRRTHSSAWASSTSGSMPRLSRPNTK